MKTAKPPSQNDRILAALAAGDKLTPIDALERFGCFHLASRIDDLHKLGHTIHRELVKIPSGKRVAQYSMPMGD